MKPHVIFLHHRYATVTSGLQRIVQATEFAALLEVRQVCAVQKTIRCAWVLAAVLKVIQSCVEYTVVNGTPNAVKEGHAVSLYSISSTIRRRKLDILIYVSKKKRPPATRFFHGFLSTRPLFYFNFKKEGNLYKCSD